MGEEVLEQDQAIRIRPLQIIDVPDQASAVGQSQEQISQRQAERRLQAIREREAERQRRREQQRGERDPVEKDW